MKIFKADRRAFSWALYDWANSTCATTVMAAFVPAFLTDYWSLGTDPVLTTARLGIANSSTSIIVALFTPFLGVLSDQRGSKKKFCFIFMLVGALASGALAFVSKGDWFSALFIFGICMIGFNASLVFYDSLLPSVATPANSDYISSLGYGLGYLGGGILFAVNILMCLQPRWFGLADAVQGVQASFLSVAVWWILFSIPLFKNVPEPHQGAGKGSLWESLLQTVSKLWQTFLDIRKNKNLLFFLVAFWIYIDGIYTVMTMAVDYGKAINLQTNDLMKALLLVQFLGFPFSLVFSRLAKWWGCKIPILVSIGIYGVAVVLATWMTEAWHFFVLASLIGIVQGGVQALSRSLFSRMIPAQNSGEYFALFNLVGKFAAILGPLIVAASAYVTGNPRFGLMGLLLLFVAGGFLLMKVREPNRDQANVVV